MKTFTRAKLAPWQKDFLEKYASGDMSHLLEKDNIDAALDVDDCGDTFVRAGLVELDPREGCETYEDAVRRLRTIADEFLAVAQEIEDTLA